MAVDQPSEDWPVQAADTIERLVGEVRDKTAGPAVTISRNVVYGLVAALVGLAVMVMLCIALVRLINNYLPQEVWAAHLIVGLLFCSAGFFLWSKRV